MWARVGLWYAARKSGADSDLGVVNIYRSVPRELNTGWDKGGETKRKEKKRKKNEKRGERGNPEYQV